MWTSYAREPIALCFRAYVLKVSVSDETHKFNNSDDIIIILAYIVAEHMRQSGMNRPRKDLALLKSLISSVIVTTQAECKALINIHLILSSDGRPLCYLTLPRQRCGNGFFQPLVVHIVCRVSTCLCA